MCILTSFWVLAHSNAGWNIFLVFSDIFCIFCILCKYKKTVYLAFGSRLPKAGCPPTVGQLPGAWGYPIFLYPFQLLFFQREKKDKTNWYAIFLFFLYNKTKNNYKTFVPQVKNDTSYGNSLKLMNKMKKPRKAPLQGLQHSESASI